MRCLVVVIVLLVVQSDRALAEEGWNYIGQLEGDQTVTFDTRDNRYPQFITGLSRPALRIHGVSVVVQSGDCDFAIETGYTFNMRGGVWRADQLLSASKSMGGRGALAIIPAPPKLIGFDPVRINVFRTDNGRSQCRYRFYQRYRTLSYALFQAQFTGALDTIADEALRRALLGETAEQNQQDGGVIIALILANNAIQDFLVNGFTVEMAIAGDFSSPIRSGVRRSVVHAIETRIGQPLPRDLELYANVISAMTGDLFWSLYKDPLMDMAGISR
jgi:hypothetical protein